MTMLQHESSWTAELERRAVAALNSVARPSIQRGLGSPCLVPWGLVVLEHKGRRTGRTYTSPLLAMRLGRRVLGTTYRKERSHWIRNLEAWPRTHLWMNGRRRPYRARVVGGGGRNDTLEAILERPLWPAVRALVAAGFAVSVLEPMEA